MSAAALDKAIRLISLPQRQIDPRQGASQSHAMIISPIDGIVARRHAELGDMATPGKPLFTIYAPGGLVGDGECAAISLASNAAAFKLRVSNFPNSNKWVDATEVKLLPTADAATHVSWYVSLCLICQMRCRGCLPGSILSLVRQKADWCLLRLCCAVVRWQRFMWPVPKIVS